VLQVDARKRRTDRRCRRQRRHRQLHWYRPDGLRNRPQRHTGRRRRAGQRGQRHLRQVGRRHRHHQQPHLR
jgi:hypothetical protein